MVEFIQHIGTASLDIGRYEYRGAVVILRDDPNSDCVEVKIEYKNEWKKIFVTHQLMFDKSFAWQEIINHVLDKWEFLSSDQDINQIPAKTDFDDRVEYWRKFFG